MGEIRNLQFGAPKRKQFTVDGDETRVIEIDTGDTGILGRWSSVKKWFESVQERLEAMPKIEENSEESADQFSAEFNEMSNEVRQQLNILFDSDVCTPIVGNGSMLRTVNGEPLFMLTLETLLPLYEEDIKVEMQKSQKKIDKHTAKYKK